MPNTDPRIEQFRKMAAADPDNELGHFSLGRACLDVCDFEQAVESFSRVIQIKPDMSKAYELLATALLGAGQRDRAIEQLQQGVRVAHARGDVLPRDAMLKKLADMGAAAPELATGGQHEAVGEGQVLCGRCGRVGPKLAKPPFGNARGERIAANICMPCWREWVAMGTKVINELRLPMNDPAAQRVFEQHMMEFLNLK